MWQIIITDVIIWLLRYYALFMYYVNYDVTALGNHLTTDAFRYSIGKQLELNSQL